MTSVIARTEGAKRSADVVVIGSGVIGAATARALMKSGRVKSVVVLEKEAMPAVHTSGRNSGVVHSGFNLKPGSLKAKFCVEGNQRLRQFCEEKHLPLQSVGTLVVALEEKEISVLEELLRRAQKNGVPDVLLIDAAGLKKLEPNANGRAALHSPSGAIASGKAVTKALAEEAIRLGAVFHFNERVQTIEEAGSGFRVKTKNNLFEGRFLINCAGLYADEIAHHLGVGLDMSIVPFRGQYFQLKAEKAGLLNSMIYPVPDLNYPFLGIHWTKTIDGQVIIGPNATIALGRESYSPTDIRWAEAAGMMFSRNFLALLSSKEFRRMALQQLSISLSRKKFVEEARRLISNVSEDDFVPGKSGNRAQLVNSKGELVDDMVVERKGNSLHVLNAVSPGFTGSLPFADYLVDRLFAEVV